MPDAPPIALAVIAGLVRASSDAIAAEVRALGELARIRPAPTHWCANEIVGHLLEADRRGFVGRIRDAIEHDRPTFESWDQPAVAAARQDAARDPAELVGSFLRQRDEDLELIAGIGPAELARTGVHPRVGVLSVGDLAAEWAHHDREHLAQLGAVTQALLWPSMGNARRFTDPHA